MLLVMQPVQRHLALGSFGGCLQVVFVARVNDLRHATNV